METLAKAQTEIGKEIEQIIVACRAQPSEQKTVQNLEEKLESVNKLWQKFEDNDDEIRRKFGQSIDHLYFTTDYYRTVKSAYESFQEEVKASIMQIKAREESQGAELIPSTPSEANIRKTPIQLSTNTNNIESNDYLARLLRRYKGVIAALKNIINGIVISDDQSRQYYEVKVASIKRYWDQIEDLNSSIWEATENLLVDDYNPQEYFELQDEVQTITIQINQELEKKVNYAPNTTVTACSSNNQAHMKLPKVVLPKFDGDYLKWQQFYDLFTQMVHNQQMGNSQKMWYLKTNLSGEAEKLIRHLPLTDNNYQIAWDILKNRYKNKRLLVTALLDKLMAQPSITMESANALKNLHDTTKECLLSLQNLGVSVKEYWDPIIIHILMKKLDKTTHALYEQSLTAPRDLQSVDKLLHFLEMRFQALEALGQKPGASKGIQNSNKPSVLITNKTHKLECPVCKRSHALYYCETFLKMPSSERQEKAKELNLCLNCLKKGHNFNKCLSRGCQKCNKKHNTLLHSSASINQVHRSDNGKPLVSQSTMVTNVAEQIKDTNSGYVFLGTALADALDIDGKPILCRILLDSGSQLNFITEKLRKKLRLAESKINLNISGIGDSKVKVNNRLNVTLKSKSNNYTTQLEVYVIKEISAQQPQQYINIDSWDIPSNLMLADPEFNKPQRIDILLGAEVYGEIMRNGQIKLNENLPMLQNTTLGWIVLGKVASIDYHTPFCGITNIELEKQLQRFWEIEECPNTSIMSITDKKCEEYFESTTIRNADGRFIVSLPMLSDPRLLGESKELAFKRLLSIERRLLKEPDLKKQYNAFLEEYLDLGHMREINTRDVTKPYCFLPHHFVLKPSSSTTKLRVVFDASAKTSNNLSLNDLLLKGPKIQEDISSIITRFRCKKYVFTADITKMYRQILIAEEDKNLQLIMWRQQHTDPIKYYQLCTVTYGTKSAPYLAIKCLQKLAIEESHQYPLGAAAIKDFYVDDVLTGSDSLEEAINIQNELKYLLGSAGFQLRKWCANHPKLVQNIPNQDLEIQLNFSEMEGEHVKTLGLVWHPIMDMFSIVTALKDYKKITKRIILADVSQIFDPLGLVNPIVVMGKLFIQKLWKLKIDWDDEIPVELHSAWLQYRNELQKLNDIRIPRYIFSNEIVTNIQLHAFADASEKAYGTAIYMRSREKTGNITVNLLCAKSRVAPIKPTTLARLELCAAKLTAQIVAHVKNSINVKIEETYYWSDSLIVINWIRGDPSIRKTFVANRIAAIQELTKSNEWKYVNTKDNPADLVSRGLFPEQLKQSKLWFNGPEFLKTSKSNWPQEPKLETKAEEEDKPVKFILTATKKNEQHPLYSIDHGNSFRKLQRVMAYILRSIKLMKFRRSRANTQPFLTVRELEEALLVIIKEVQRSNFLEEIRCLQQNKEIHKSSKLKTLSPFIDCEGLLRVGGRLQAADIAYDAKHPILLPADNFITKLLMNDLHKLHLHAGPQALHTIARQKYWILQGRNIARSVVNNCIRCTKVRPRLCMQKMGNLPKDRVQRARPFINCGVDFCGPVYTHFKIRGKRPQKTYIAVFCCFATKAIHLEVVSDLSTEGFIGALKRFISRRGICENIYCDNGRNFVGTNNQLQEIYKTMTDNKSKEKITNACLNQKIQFHFIPPRSPHFGGLWEAAVKSTKSLLQRTVASSSLTYEELCTVIAEIEAILNSRPLTPLSPDPNDLAPLTPAHFLIGEPMTSTVNTTNEKEKMSLASRWALINHLRNEFWKRWSVEYLGELQKRAKWFNQHPNIQPGTLVTLKDENLPPLKWSLGRVTETIVGPDGKVRVADIKTPTGIFRRAIQQLAPLPVDINEDTDDMEVDEPQREESPSKERKNEDVHASKRRKRKHSSGTLNTAKVFLVTMLILPLSSLSMPLSAPSVPMLSSPIEISNFNKKAGIFFENLGLARITANNWNLLVYYDLNGYWATITAIKQGLKQLERLSRTINNNNYYAEIINQYYHQLEEININNLLLERQENATTKIRRKRSPLDIIGTVANKLFGILDNDYSVQMSETINKIKTNEDHLHELIKNQTSVLETTVNVIKKGEEERLKQTKEIEDAIEVIYNKMRNLTTESKQQKTIQAFNTLSILISSLLSECRFMQDALIDVIMDTHHGRSNPLVIAPDQMRMQLKLIKENLPSEVELPSFHEQISISLIYKLMSIHCQIEGNYVIFALKIPLVLTTVFELYRLVPFPTLVNGTFISIAPTSDFLMTNVYRDQFYLLKQFELMQCMKVEDSYYLCQQHRPINSRTSKGNICEIELFSHKALPTTCALKIINSTKVWIQLWSPNRWLFAFDKEYDLTFVCGNNFLHRTLSGNGILSMQGGCTMKDEEFTIKALNDVQSQTMRESFQPNIDITSNDVNNSEDNFPSFTHSQLITHENELTAMLKEIDTIKSQQTELKELQPHDMHLFSVGYTALGITSIIIIYIIITRLQNKRIVVINKNSAAASLKKTHEQDYKIEVGDFKGGQDVHS